MEYSALERGDEILPDVAILQVPAKIAPHRLEPLYGLRAVS
jgi:hypothetical protein